MDRRIFFVGTAKSGLGHIRRIASVAAHMSSRSGHDECILVTNAEPAALSRNELGAFTRVCVCERDQMAERLVREGCDLAVLDTVKLPGFERFRGKAALILRETPDANLAGFRRAGSLPWDAVVMPNPKDEWNPDFGPDFAGSVVHAGWIQRAAGIRGDSPSTGIVVATGGGGTAETRRRLYPLLNAILAETRTLVAHRFTVRQAVGPRAGGEILVEADEIFDPGSALNDVFRRADLVISTAGYNSVLELAGTDTPALLVAIPRSLDDQMARVRRWGPLVGHGYKTGKESEAAIWLAEQIGTPRRRALLDLGSSGAERAAKALQELL